MTKGEGDDRPDQRPSGLRGKFQGGRQIAPRRPGSRALYLHTNNYWLEQLRIDPLKAGEFTRHLLIPFGCTGLYPRSLSSAGVNSASRSP